MRVRGGVALLIIAMSQPGFAAVNISAWPETSAMLAAPDDAEAVFTFAQRARAAGNLADAANALERYLRFHPAEERALILVAEIYDEMGSPERAAAFRSLLPKAAPSGYDISGFVSVGAAYDTNPAAAPLDSNVGFFFASRGEVIEIDIGAEPDDSFLGSVRAEVNIAPVDGADGPPVFATINGYMTHFDDAEDQDEYGASVKFGTELPADDARLRVYGFADADFFDHRLFSVAGFAGADYRFAWGDTLVTLDGRAGYRDFKPNANAPDRDEMDGIEGRLSLSLLRELDENLIGYAFFAGSVRDAAVGYESRFGAEAIGALIASAPEDSAISGATLTVGGGAAAFRYFGADPTFDALNDRKDLSLFAFGTAAFPIAEDVTFDLSLSYRRRFSEYDIYESDGLRAGVKLVKRF